MAEHRIVRTRDTADLAKRAASELAALVNTTRAARFTIALSGGSTPKALYEVLSSPEVREVIPWKGVELFFGDERSVPPDHPDSNFRMARLSLIDPVGAKAYRMEAEAGRADDYETLVRQRVPAGQGGLPQFDLVLLGIGPDGHTASLFPGTAALAETKRLVVMNDVPQMKTCRMTFTYPLINAARRIWVLVAGDGKRDIVSKVFDAEDSKQFPILGVRPTSGEMTWWVDEEAAKGIPA